ncbi:hypothetical protein CAEBREN_14321 [Caenorhabditis brenneri]|uniref:C-type lectin domain-containing protein n=1 Tax=Caenorhabditis brenneri TaxID=135651 RepID=G0MQD9_CAEBE|nr:hypothetical protein CAEBREN_14321 [Caenorhabditis brenneri]
MKLFIFFMIVVAISCQDDSNHGCKTNCDCPDFTTLFNDQGKEDLLFTQGEGCTFNSTCKYVAQGAVQALWKDSEIETPTETRDNFFSVIDSEEPVATFDMFSLFGIICKKGAWYITKYPSGIWYWTLDSEEVSFGTAEELDGKKSKIYYAMW